MDAIEIIADMTGWVVIAAVLLLVPVWRIHKRAGLFPWLSLLVLVPIIGVIASSLILAFRRWPAISRRSEIGGEGS